MIVVCDTSPVNYLVLIDEIDLLPQLASCGACDVCLGETNSLPDATVTAQKILSCVARVGERFGVRHVCEVLRGAKTEGVDRDLFERLRKWRRRVAEARGKPAWTILDLVAGRAPA